MHDLEPVELCQAVRRRETAALSQLYRELRAKFLVVCVRDGGDDAEDLLHETWRLIVEAIQNQTLKDPERLYSYARVILRRLATRLWTGRRRERPTDRLAA